MPAKHITRLAFSFLMFWSACLILYAQDQIPKSRGFSGYLVPTFGISNIATNRIVEGSPLQGDFSDQSVESIDQSPSYNEVNLMGLVGELNYTFDSARLQLFFGNRLEDLLRLDVTFGLGIRKELADQSIVALSVLTTPLLLKSWQDPYIEGENRKATEVNIPGVRFRWGSMFGTGLEFTFTARFFSVGSERSGKWLVDQGRLNAEETFDLNRNGTGLYPQLIYRIDLGKHRFEPMVKYLHKDLNGSAVSSRGYALKLTYIYWNPKVFVLDVNVKFEENRAVGVHPVYEVRHRSSPLALGAALIKPVRKGDKSLLSIFVAGEYYRENSNIEFLNSNVNAAQIGIMWRHMRK